MGENSKIEWTDHTFNPWWGCTKIAPECANCYAESFANRYKFNIWGQNTPRRDLSEQNWRLPLKWNRAAKAEGVRKRVFCASMADVFEDRDDRTRPRMRLWGLIKQCDWLDWMLLTKRPKNIHPLAPFWWSHEPPKNVAYGTSVGCRKSLPLIDELRVVPASMRFLSMEPLLEDVGTLDLTGISWVIVGGESGPGARPMYADWARSIRDQCQTAGVAFFMKQIDKKQPIPVDLMIREWPGSNLVQTKPEAQNPHE